MLFLIFAYILSSQVFGKVHGRWFSVASLVIEDEKTRIFFDPMFTRAGLQHWLALSDFRSDEPLVTKILKENGLNKIDALFASHSHFDHVIDAPIIAKLTGGVFYVDENSEIIAKAHKEPKIQIQRVENRRPIVIGDFKITPVLRTHSHIRSLGFSFLPGKVSQDFDFGFYDYKVGDTWFYLIEHPDGKILFDQGAEPFLDEAKKVVSQVDVLIQGVANRENDDTIIKGYAHAFKPKVFLPSHFDNFFFPFDPVSIPDLPGIRLKEVLDKMQKSYPEMEVIMPVYGKRMVLLK